MNYKAAPQHSSEYAGKKKDHYHNPDGSFSFTRKQAKERKMTKKAAIEGGKAGTKVPTTMKYDAAAQMGHSPAEMSPYKMESAKQEKYNLLHDNPVAKHASGGSWMSKHSKSAFQMGHESPAKNVGHGMDDMSPEKGAHRKYHLKQRMSKKSKD